MNTSGSKQAENNKLTNLTMDRKRQLYITIYAVTTVKIVKIRRLIFIKLCDKNLKKIMKLVHEFGFVTFL